MVAVQYTREGAGLKTCSGIIVSKNEVLVAANCVRNIKTLHVIFGAINLSKAEHVLQVPLENVQIYSDFADKGGSYDLAVITFNQHIEFSDNVFKIVYKTNVEVSEDKKITILQYSTFKKSHQSTLSYITSNLADFEESIDMYNNINEVSIDEFLRRCAELWEIYCRNGNFEG